ncbi:uncharacterized protein LOC120327252 [Styela clava]
MYVANSAIKLSSATLFLMRSEGVPRDVVAALYADTVTGAEWLMAFKDGKLDTTRLLEIISKNNHVSIDPFFGLLAAGKSPWKWYLKELEKSTGKDMTFVDLFLSSNFKSVLKHLIALTYVKQNHTEIPIGVVNNILSGNKHIGAYLIDHFVNILIPYNSENSSFRDAFYRALYSKNIHDAIYWAYLVSLYDKYPQDSFYPNNTSKFVSLINQAKTFPGRISRTVFDDAALDTKFNKGKSFTEIFGKKAKDYVCKQHPQYLFVKCQNLKTRTIVTPKQCLNAGCCVTQVGPQKRRICHENYLGNIGMKMAFSNETATDLQNFFNFAQANFIPWVPNNKLPRVFLNFRSSPNANSFINFYPTVMPIDSHPIFRPNYTWKPHGPTVFPFPARPPKKLLAPTDMSLIQHEPDGGGPPGLTAGIFKPSCSVSPVDRYQCIDNSVALARGGREDCLAKGCCYVPDWRNLTIPACFRRLEYGQCYNVTENEREECGYPGINKTECLKNRQCCYDSTISVQGTYDRIPWCYYKKRSPVVEKERCSRSLPHVRRQGCFRNHNLNFVISRESCEAVEGCCYQDVKLRWFDRVIGRQVKPPPCYIGRQTDLTPRDILPRPPRPRRQCQYKNVLQPHQRVDCNPKLKLNWFACLRQGCCFEALPSFPRFPWCFKKSLL